MPVRKKEILVQLCCLILGALIESTGLRISKHSNCLRKCRLDRREGAERGVQVSRSILSCHEQCLLGREAPQALTGQTIKQRRRKSLHNLVITKSSTECPPPSLSPAGEWTPSEVEVAFGQYVNTTDWYVNATWTSMNDSLGNWNSILIRLSVEVPEKVVDPLYCFVLPKNQTFFTVNISSYYYQYPDPIYLQVIGLPFTNASSLIDMFFPEFRLDISAIVLKQDGFATHRTDVDPTKNSTTTTKGPSSTIAYVSISAGTLVGLVVVVCLLGHYLQRKKGNVPLPLDFKYHAFIIYNSEDKLWMKNKLLPFLEEKHHLTCCVHYRDFVLGKPFRDNMADSVYTSKKVIALFSNNFVNSNYCMYELDIALGRLVERRDDSIVVIRIDKADLKHLPQELKRRSLIDYGDSLERLHWKRRLIEFLGSPEGSRSQSTSDEQSCDIKNGNEYSMDGNGNRARNGFNRPESTTSNVSEISIL